MATQYSKYGKAYYEKNKALCVERNRINQERYKQRWQDYKATLACANCGQNHPATLDFHHTDRHDPTKKRVNALIKNRQYAQAYKEIEEKCIILCANCHRIHHHEEHMQKNAPHAEGPTKGVKQEV